MPVITGPVTIDGMIVAEGHYNPAVRWNGWLAPVFDRAEAGRIAAWANAEDAENTLFHWDGDVLVYAQLNYPDSEPERIEPDTDGRYAVGGFSWVWSAVGED